MGQVRFAGGAGGLPGWARCGLPGGREVCREGQGRFAGRAGGLPGWDSGFAGTDMGQERQGCWFAGKVRRRAVALGPYMHTALWVYMCSHRATAHLLTFPANQQPCPSWPMSVPANPLSQPGKPPALPANRPCPSRQTSRPPGKPHLAHPGKPPAPPANRTCPIPANPYCHPRNAP
jgi:hypothetical protein